MSQVHIKESHEPSWSHVLRLLHAMKTEFTLVRTEMDALVQEIHLYVLNRGGDGSTGNGDSKDSEGLSSVASINGDTTIPITTTPTRTKRPRRFEINPEALVFLSEVQDCIALLSLRARQVQKLYLSRDIVYSSDTEGRAELQRQARSLVHQAEEVRCHMSYSSCCESVYELLGACI